MIHYGYVAIFILSALESACIPIPSEVVLPYGGYLAAQHALNVTGVIVIATIANLVGGLVTYYIGRYGGRALVLRYGRFILLNKNHLDWSEAWFEKRGELTVLIGRLLPAVRTFISLPAGMAQMSVSRFIIFTILGALPWNIALSLTGYYLGRNWSVVDAHLKPLTYFGAVVLVVGIVWFWSRRKRSDKHP
jgi:membrane protein DedA with SNARE-associated domain